MCNPYSITTNQEAIRQLFRVVNRYVGNLPPGVFPDYPAPVIRNAGAERELALSDAATVELPGSAPPASGPNHSARHRTTPPRRWQPDQFAAHLGGLDRRGSLAQQPAWRWLGERNGS
jgi:hypothetical protein